MTLYGKYHTFGVYDPHIYVSPASINGKNRHIDDADMTNAFIDLVKNATFISTSIYIWKIRLDLPKTN